MAFLGGTIGNLVPAERAPFLAGLRATLAPGDSLLLGTDLVKDPGRLVAAYDDAAGVTAEFNRNVLRVIDRRLGGDLDPGRFAHVACWDAEQEWIEMRLRSIGDQVGHIADLGLTVGVRRRRGDAHRGERQVPAFGRGGRAGGGRLRAARTGGPTPPATSPCRCRRPSDCRPGGPPRRWRRTAAPCRAST